QGGIGIEVVADFAVGPAPGVLQHLVGQGDGGAPLPAGHQPPGAGGEGAEEDDEDDEDEGEGDDRFEDAEARVFAQAAAHAHIPVSAPATWASNRQAGPKRSYTRRARWTNGSIFGNS